MEIQFNAVQIQSQTTKKCTSNRRPNKKTATKPSRRQNDIYITTKSNFKVNVLCVTPQFFQSVFLNW